MLNSAALLRCCMAAACGGMAVAARLRPCGAHASTAAAVRCSPPPRAAASTPRQPRRSAPLRAKGGSGGSGSSTASDSALAAPPLAPAAAAACAEALASIAAANAAAEAPTNLVLIGGRGCGKSSLCRRIAALDSRWQLFPLDTLITYEADGLSIAEIVAKHGWPHFRDVEFETVRKATSLREWSLVDAGGGAVVDLFPDGAGGHVEALSARKVNAMRRRALVVYIRRDIKYLEHRIAKKAAEEAKALAAEGGAAIDPATADKNRPALDPTAGFAAIMARREAWYQAAAHVVVEGCNRDGSARPKEEICADVLRAFWTRASPGGVRGGDRAETRELLSKQAAGIAALAQCLA